VLGGNAVLVLVVVLVLVLEMTINYLPPEAP